ncbi:phosphoglycerate dehydrogenase [Ammoniphilus sp. YIM 78166]|uniref:phosphoglycerate dehydrogenase n=1 Tax=Ammoniphilus sp. YIM 78166 TaxID=1644106 RepID=UPI00107041C2|nr:phosphoglycerate dehydrogenase [Ammoniphilus sp. YIM 78166]
MFKVVSTSPTFGKYSLDPVRLLESEGCEVVILPAEISHDEERLAKALENVDGLIVGVEKITRNVLRNVPKLKVIAKHGAGVDNIDLQAAAEKDLPVAFAPGANRHAVADLAVGLMLSLAREIPRSFTQVREGEWPRVIGFELFGKTLGVIGTGKIGKEVIRRAQGFQMKVLAYDLYPDKELSEVQYVPLDQLYQESDFITVHTDLNEQSKAMIAAPQLEAMKSTAFIVNTARGGIIDEQDLFVALKEGKIGGAALDVFSIEPAGQSPLLELPNFIATPHMAGYTYEALREVGMITARNVLNAIQGRRPEHVYEG